MPFAVAAPPEPLPVPPDPLPVDVMGPPPAPPAPPANTDVAALGDFELYVFLGVRSHQLYECLRPYMERSGGIGPMAARLQAAGRYPALAEATAGVLGSSHSLVRSARESGQGSPRQAAGLIAALGAYASETPPQGDLRARLLRAKAISIAAVELAGVSEGACTASPALLQAMARVRPEP
ncbi:hypothetical protein [Lysobacter silvisoli]|nr:hypothetical protein [Lysobacter silvisoli]